MMVVFMPPPVIVVLLFISRSPMLLPVALFSVTHPPVPLMLSTYVPAGRVMTFAAGLVGSVALLFALVIAPRKLQSLAAPVHAESAALSTVVSTVLETSTFSGTVARSGDSD